MAFTMLVCRGFTSCAGNKCLDCFILDKGYYGKELSQYLCSAVNAFILVLLRMGGYYLRSSLND